MVNQVEYGRVASGVCLLQADRADCTASHVVKRLVEINMRIAETKPSAVECW